MSEYETIEHSVEEESLMCCFQVYKFKVTHTIGEKVKNKKRLVCRSYTLAYHRFINYIIFGGIITGIDFVLKGKLMEFSLSDHPWGIKSL